MTRVVSFPTACGGDGIGASFGTYILVLLLVGLLLAPAKDVRLCTLAFRLNG
jgi:hypothetical protein